MVKISELWYNGPDNRKTKGKKMKFWNSYNHIQQKRPKAFRNMPDLHIPEKPIKKVKPGMRAAVIAVISLSIMLTGCTSQHEEGEEPMSMSEYMDNETEETASMETHSEESDAENEMKSTDSNAAMEPQDADPETEPGTGFSAAADMSPIHLENPGIGYYLAEEPETAQEHTLRLEQIYEKANAITDEEGWFAANQLEIPFYVMPGSFAEGEQLPEQIPDSFKGFPLTQAWFDDSVIYCVYGEVYYEGYLLNLYEKATCEPVMSLDFSAFCSEEYEYGEYQWVRWARVDGQTLYVSLSHNTYSENAPNHAYIVAVDLTDMNILWKTEPLVSNARNFEIIGNEIVCGYGFTAEDDFLYRIDRDTGRILEQIPVNSQADYIIRKEDQLFVRTYDTNYVFQITQ